MVTSCQPSLSGTAAEAWPEMVARTVCRVGDLSRMVSVASLIWSTVSGTSRTACPPASATRLPSSTLRNFQVRGRLKWI